MILVFGSPCKRESLHLIDLLDNMGAPGPVETGDYPGENQKGQRHPGVPVRFFPECPVRFTDKIMKGCLITFEGIEGSGKSTQLARLVSTLKKNDCNVLVTREPGGTQLGERIRDILLDTRHHQMTPKTEVLLYLASRMQHLQEVILPALDQGQIVLCDRFSEATLAYQGYGRQLPLTQIRQLNRYVTGQQVPNLTLLLDVEVRRGLRRIRSRPLRDRLDQEKMQFYQKVRQGYLQMARQSPRRIVVINANENIRKVAAQIHQVVETFLKKRSR